MGTQPQRRPDGCAAAIYTEARAPGSGTARRPAGTRRILDRVGLLAVTAVYVAVNIYNYLHYLTPVWGYQGFPEFDPQRGAGPLALACACCLVFAFAYPSAVTLYSRFVVWFLFFFVYVPSAVIVSMQGIPDDGGYLLIACLTASLLLISLLPEAASVAARPASTLGTAVRPSGGNWHALRDLAWSPRIELAVLVAFALLSLGLVGFYSSIIALVDITNVYDQRDIVSEYSPNRSLAAYALQWLVRVLSPFMIAVGIVFRRRLLLALGSVGMLVGFFVTGSKFIVFLIPLMYGVHFFVLRRRRISAQRIGVLLCAIMTAMLLLIELYGQEAEGLVGLILSQVVKRAFSINGMTLGNYHDFFINHANPFTLYSHLGPVALFVDYPYQDLGIGQVVGYFQVGLYTYDMSAGFWSTDGIAAAGYVGVVLIGAVLGALLALFDVWARRIDLRLLCLSSLGCVWMLADTSVFRVLLSGGWPLHFLLVHWVGVEARRLTARGDAAHGAGGRSVALRTSAP